MKARVAAVAATLAVSAVIGQVPAASADTVLTFEGGVVGLQPWFHFTPLQLQGDLCKSPNTCQPVNYFAMPLGQWFNDQGAIKLNQALDALPSGTHTVLFGHSQGGQVIYSALRDWAANPAIAPDPADVSWVSIGNPENTFGGKAPDPIPANSPYQGTEVIRQYDGWADWPTDKGNLLARLNAVVGQQLVHPNYWNVDLNDPNNIRYVEGNVTYVFVPNPMLPLVQLTGPFAPLLNPILDPILRPIVEAGYNRPIGPVSGISSSGISSSGVSNSASPNPPAAVAVPARSSAVGVAVTAKPGVTANRAEHAKPAAAAKRRGPLRSSGD